MSKSDINQFLIKRDRAGMRIAITRRMQLPMKPRLYWIRLSHQLESLRILMDLEIDPAKDFSELNWYEIERLVDKTVELGYFVPRRADRAHYFYEQLQRRSRPFMMD